MNKQFRCTNCTNLVQIRELSRFSKPNILVISESWLNSSVTITLRLNLKALKYFDWIAFIRQGEECVHTCTSDLALNVTN